MNALLVQDIVKLLLLSRTHLVTFWVIATSSAVGSLGTLLDSLHGLRQPYLTVSHYFYARTYTGPLRKLYCFFLYIKHRGHSRMSEYKQFYLRAGFRSSLNVGDVLLSHIDVKIATWLYDEKGFTLWEVKEAGFRHLTLKQICCAIKHGRWDRERVTYHQRPAMFWNPDNYVINEYRVGQPRFIVDDPEAQELAAGHVA